MNVEVQKHALGGLSSFHQAGPHDNHETQSPTPCNFLASDNFWNLQLGYLWNRGIYPSSRLCSADGCHKRHMANGLCESHRWQERKKTEWKRKLKDERYQVWRERVAERKVARSCVRAGLIPRKEAVKKDPIIKRYKMAVYECEKRLRNNFKWLISLEDFRWLCLQPCFYCGGRLGNVRYGKGLDRIDSTKDYVMDNVYPCCTSCNRIKGHDLTASETKRLIEALFIMRGPEQEAEGAD